MRLLFQFHIHSIEKTACEKVVPLHFAVLITILVFVIAGLFSLVLSRVFDAAVAYKLENDLTI